MLNKTKQKLTLMLVSVILITGAAAIYYFFSTRLASIPSELVKEVVKRGASLALDKVHQSSTKNGKKEWSLDADSAKYFKELSEVHFKNIAITYYSETQGEIILTAMQGILNTDTNNLLAEGDVLVRSMEGNIRTDQLHYTYSKRIIETDRKVVIFKKDSQITADSMIMNLGENKIILNGNIEGFFSEKLK